MTIIAIDPGYAGGIAWANGKGVFCAPMPETPKDIYDWLYDHVIDPQKVECFLEDVGSYMPGNSGPAAVKFARHCGHLEMALMAIGIKINRVRPAIWEHALIGRPNYPKIPKDTAAKERSRILAARKAERKNKIKARVQELYPGCKVTLKTADALGILAWHQNL